jgi:excisionase family DNA binding protein
MSPRKKNFGTIATGASCYKVSEKTLRRWVAEGRITGYRFGPRMIRVDLNEIEQLLKPIPTADGGEVA